MKDLGKAKTIIRWEITKDIEAKTLKIYQKKYIRDFLEAKEITSYYITVSSIKTRSFISMDQADDDNPANLVIYQRLIEKLIYLTCGTRSKIFFLVGLLSQYNFDLRVGYLRVAKQVFAIWKK